MKEVSFIVRQPRLCCLLNGEYHCLTCGARVCIPCNDEDERFVVKELGAADDAGKALRKIGHFDAKCLLLKDAGWEGLNG